MEGWTQLHEEPCLRIGVIRTRRSLLDDDAVDHFRANIRPQAGEIGSSSKRNRRGDHARSLLRFSAVFTDPRLPAEFNEIRYPQMLERLALRRSRTRQS